MNSQKSTLNAVQENHETKTTITKQGETALKNFINAWDARADFFADAFVSKVKDQNKKALGELQKHAMPPTRMDLRNDLSLCLLANLSDDQIFAMKNGRSFTLRELKFLVPEWAKIAESALIKSDPAMADKLMSPVQWNAKSAFEVIFVSAMNELKNLRKSGEAAGFAHYKKWILNPLKEAIENVKKTNPPHNALIGYGKRIPLSEAMELAAKIEEEFIALAK